MGHCDFAANTLIHNLMILVLVDSPVFSYLLKLILWMIGKVVAELTTSFCIFVNQFFTIVFSVIVAPTTKDCHALCLIR